MRDEQAWQEGSLEFLFSGVSARSFFLKLVIIILVLTGIAHIALTLFSEFRSSELSHLFGFASAYITLGLSALLIFLNRFRWGMSILLGGFTLTHLGIVVLFHNIPTFVYIGAFNLIMMSGVLISPKAGLYTFFAFTTGFLGLELGWFDSLNSSIEVFSDAQGTLPEILTLLFSVVMTGYGVNKASTLLRRSHAKTLELSKARDALSRTTEANVLRAREGAYTAELAQNMMRSSSPGHVFSHFAEQTNEALGECSVAVYRSSSSHWNRISATNTQSSQLEFPQMIPMNPPHGEPSRAKSPLSEAFKDTSMKDGEGTSFFNGVLWRMTDQDGTHTFVIVAPLSPNQHFTFQEKGLLKTFHSLVFVTLMNLRVLDQFRQAQKLEAVALLARGIAHEFNNLLTTISGNVEMAILGSKGDEVTLQRLRKVDQAIQQAGSLTRKLLTMSHESDWTPEVVNINNALSRVIKMMEVSRPEKTTVKLSLDPAEPKAYLDKHSLETALVNLLLNAQESLPEQEGIIQVTVTLEHDVSATGNSMVSIAVMDTGIGMSEREQEKVFTPFFTTRAKDKGTGLGLSSVTELMDQVNGVCHLTSARGRGSTFELHIPAYTANVPTSEKAPVLPTANPQGKMELILVVEDEQHVRSTIVEMLTQAQYKTLEASSIQQAKTLLSKRKEIALVLSDILMPGETGIDLLEVMETMKDAPELILMTGFSYQRPNSINALVLDKPISMDTLLTAVSRKIKRSS